MKPIQPTRCIGAVLATGLCLLNGNGTGNASADDFYKGKRIEFIIGQPAGGTYDQWSRLIGRHMGNHIPGAPSFIPKNMPGAGHIKATNFLFSLAPKDGTAIGMFSRTIPSQSLMKHPAVQFNSTDFNWIGSPELTNRVCVAKRGAAVQKGEDLFAQDLLVAGLGAGSSPSTTPRILTRALGLRLKLVDGYDSPGNAMLAIDRDEVQGICQTVSGLDQAKPRWFEDGHFVVLFSMEKKPIARFNAPTVYQFTKTEEQRQIISFFSSATELGRPIAAPPGVPSQRVQMLRRAFDATMKDPAFVSDAGTQKLEINALTGEELADRVLHLSRTPLEIVDKTKEMAGIKDK